MKSFYIAGRVKNVPIIRNLAAELERRGLRWSYNWTEHGPIAKPLKLDDRRVGAFAQQCLDAIAKSDLFILIAQDSVGARGFYIELGAALANNVPVWIVGDEEPSVFSCLPQIEHLADTEILLIELQKKYSTLQ